MYSIEVIGLPVSKQHLNAMLTSKQYANEEEAVELLHELYSSLKEEYGSFVTFRNNELKFDCAIAFITEND